MTKTKKTKKSAPGERRRTARTAAKRISFKLPLNVSLPGNPGTPGHLQAFVYSPEFKAAFTSSTRRKVNAAVARARADEIELEELDKAHTDLRRQIEEIKKQLYTATETLRKLNNAQVDNTTLARPQPVSQEDIGDVVHRPPDALRAGADNDGFDGHADVGVEFVEDESLSYDPVENGDEDRIEPEPEYEAPYIPEGALIDEDGAVGDDPDA